MKFVRTKAFFYSSLAVLLACLLGLGGWFFVRFRSVDPSPSPAVTAPTEPTVTVPQNPIDFAEQQAKNPDIYAWIRIPDTVIDFPVLQSGSGEKEDYYLYYTADRERSKLGAIYSQRLNLKDFTDANTVLYGHNHNNGTMFSSLLNYRDRAYFDAHPTIYIYTPGHILTYTVYAAYRYDNRHLLYSFDFNDREVYADYLKMTQHPKSTIVNEREGIELTPDDRILTLSTCITNHNYRYLVQGVLTDDQPTA